MNFKRLPSGSLFFPFLTPLLIKNIDKMRRLVVAYVYWKVFRLILIFN